VTLWQPGAGGALVPTCCIQAKAETVPSTASAGLRAGLPAWRHARRYLASGAALPALSGAALLCSAPPGGNSALVGRLMRKAPLLAARLTWCGSARSCCAAVRDMVAHGWAAQCPPQERHRSTGIRSCTCTSAMALQNVL